ncbi:MAG: nascent polypeptide-associated complex protein, partial [Nanoarchaeota archaeon]
AQEEIDAQRVIIECSDKKIIIEEPSIMKIKMQGQQQFQISGIIKEIATGEDEEEDVDHTEEDIKTIMEQTGASEKKAREALAKANGDLTEAMMGLS